MTATSTLTLSVFLLARYDEWEAEANECLPYLHDSDTINVMLTRREGAESWTKTVGWIKPREVLAQVASLRAVVELHSPRNGYVCHNCAVSGDRECKTLLALAQPFRDHPDFDPAWTVGVTV